MSASGYDWKTCPKNRKRITCVVDGDTFWMNRVKYRIYEIDTPETGRNARCRNERVLAQRATKALIEKLSRGKVELAVRGRDRYSRDLVTVYVDGKNIAREMLAEALAIRYSPARHRNGAWCK